MHSRHSYYPIPVHPYLYYPTIPFPITGETTLEYPCGRLSPQGIYPGGVLVEEWVVYG